MVHPHLYNYAAETVTQALKLCVKVWLRISCSAQLMLYVAAYFEIYLNGVVSVGIHNNTQIGQHTEYRQSLPAHQGASSMALYRK